MGTDNTCGKCGCWVPICRCDGDKSPTIQIFKPMVYEDICETPILITSRRHLREECKKHGVMAARLM